MFVSPPPKSVLTGDGRCCKGVLGQKERLEAHNHACRPAKSDHPGIKIHRAHSYHVLGPYLTHEWDRSMASLQPLHTKLSCWPRSTKQLHLAHGVGAGGRQYVGYDIWLGLTACVAPVLHDTAQHPYCMTRHMRSYPLGEQDMEGKCKQAGSPRDKTGP